MWEAARRVCPLFAIVLMAALIFPTTALAQTGQVVEFYHLDALGSVRAVSNQQGQIVSRHDFLPFGEEVTPATPQRENKLFTGKERDPETGLDYFGARYLDQKIGRFTTPDPGHIGGNIFDPQSWNAFAYAGNNPLRNIDPDGRRWFAKNGNAVWVNANKDGTYTSPGEGWVEVAPTSQYDGALNLAFVDGQLTWIGEADNGRRMQAPYMGREAPIEDETFSFLSNLQFGAGLLRGVAVRALPVVGALAAKGTTLAKVMQSEAGVEELLGGGGRVIAGAGSKELRDVARLVSQYGGKPEQWVKITSITPRIQTHAYKNIVTGVVVELKSILPGSR